MNKENKFPPTVPLMAPPAELSRVAFFRGVYFAIQTVVRLAYQNFEYWKDHTHADIGGIDVPTPGAADDGKKLTYNHSTGKMEWT